MVDSYSAIYPDQDVHLDSVHFVKVSPNIAAMLGLTSAGRPRVFMYSRVHLLPLTPLPILTMTVTPTVASMPRAATKDRWDYMVLVSNRSCRLMTRKSLIIQLNPPLLVQSYR